MADSIMLRSGGGGKKYPAKKMIAIAAEDIKKGEAVGMKTILRYVMPNLSTDTATYSDDTSVGCEVVSTTPYVKIYRRKNNNYVQDANPSILPAAGAYAGVSGNGKVVVVLDSTSTKILRYNGASWITTNLPYIAIERTKFKVSYDGNWITAGGNLYEVRETSVFQVMSSTAYDYNGIASAISDDNLTYVTVVCQKDASNSLYADISIFKRETTAGAFVRKELKKATWANYTYNVRMNENGTLIVITAIVGTAAPYGIWDMLIVENNGQYVYQQEPSLNIYYPNMVNQRSKISKNCIISAGRPTSLELKKLQMLGVEFTINNPYVETPKPCYRDYVGNVSRLWYAPKEYDGCRHVAVFTTTNVTAWFAIDDKSTVSKHWTDAAQIKGFAAEDIAAGEAGKINILFGMEK